MADNFLKRIEYFLKNKINKMILGSSIPVMIDNPKNLFNFNDPARILLLRNDRIGDILVSTPFIIKLRERFPNTIIDILLSKKNISAASAVKPYVDNIWIFDKKVISFIKLLNSLKFKDYELIIDLFDNESTTSSIIIKYLKPLYSLGLDKSNRNVYSHIVPLLDKFNNHIVDRTNLLLLPFGINPYSRKTNLYFQKDDLLLQKIIEEFNIPSVNFRIGINLSGSSRAKYWGIDNHIEFIKLINKNYPDLQVMIFGTNEYLSELNYINTLTKVIIAPTGLTFDGYANLLSTCKIILTPDTAAVHLASAFGIACIALYTVSDSPDSGMPWEPYNIISKVHKIKDDCLENIPVIDVYESFIEIYKVITNGSNL